MAEGGTGGAAGGDSALNPARMNRRRVEDARRRRREAVEVLAQCRQAKRLMLEIEADVARVIAEDAAVHKTPALTVVK